MTLRQYETALIILAIIVFCGLVAEAQEAPIRKPAPIKATTFAILNLASTGADAYFTNRNAQSPTHPGWIPSHENDPLARPFVGHIPTLVAFFSVEATGKILVSHVMRKHGHEHLADALDIGGIALNTDGAAYAATRYTEYH